MSPPEELSGPFPGRPPRGPDRRYWAVADADAFLPALDRLFDSVEAGIERHGGLVVGADPRLLLHGLVTVLGEQGVMVRDLQRRLVDFPGRGPDGDVVLGCRVGDEPRSEWGHEHEAGVAGRRRRADEPHG
ncbi:hypothetical protein BH20ACT3_BH20ACT3_15920 [soil metagenome]